MINELVQRFKIHLEEDGKSVKTIESYVGACIPHVEFSSMSIGDSYILQRKYRLALHSITTLIKHYMLYLPHKNQKVKDPLIVCGINRNFLIFLD
ncbi:hypothetical protein [Clostridium kluyveri]|uniref:Uncharacterized protein n=1 Tax=Clostridium kluyveri TaxID=1534 RepID=A0A1L5F3W5_CLOKL|nr:hypothetical protein [Clostridium kluyveri]APM37711.1 hypothetical protein BS101_02575 [Clostridium kluyveri]UZQ52267.1 hypothetical protein OP486_08955 [Clostridium kluyveri]